VKTGNKNCGWLSTLAQGRRRQIVKLYVLSGLILNFHGFLKEKLLATKPCRAIFAIPKNDVETTHLEGTDR
jgi:hypothetical protein